MKYLFRRLSPLFLFVVSFYVARPASYAQVPGSTSTDSTSSATPPVAPQHKGVMTGEEFEKVDPVAAERDRYHFFLLFFHHHEEGEKALKAEGRTELAEAYRTLLQDKSGLTEAEAIKVKHIAAEYATDVDALNQRGAELAAKYNHHRPPESESKVLTQQYADIINKAIARLVDALGSRSFSRLDLYTRHYLDASRAQTDAAARSANAHQAGQP